MLKRWALGWDGLKLDSGLHDFRGLTDFGQTSSPLCVLVPLSVIRCHSREKQVRFSEFSAKLDLFLSALLAEASVLFLKGKSNHVTRHLKNTSSMVWHFLQGRV